MFLTTKPQSRSISIDHPEWLYIYLEQTATQQYLKANITYQDGTTLLHELMSLGIPTGHDIIIANISYSEKNYQLLAPSKVIKTIEIFVGDAVADQSEEYLVLIPIKYNSDNIKALYYHNSLGGIDSFICVGDSYVTESLFATITKRSLQLNYDSFADSEMVASNQQSQTIVKVYTGNKPKGEILALNDLFLLKSAYEWVEMDGVFELIEILPTTNEVNLPEDNSNLYNASFEYRYASANAAIDKLK